MFLNYQEKLKNFLSQGAQNFVGNVQSAFQPTVNPIPQTPATPSFGSRLLSGIGDFFQQNPTPVSWIQNQIKPPIVSPIPEPTPLQNTLPRFGNVLRTAVSNAIPPLGITNAFGYTAPQLGQRIASFAQNNPSIAGTMLAAEKPLTQAKDFLSQPYKPVTLPSIDISSANPIVNAAVKVPQAGYNYLAKPLIEGAINAPSNYVGGITRTGLDIGRMTRGENVPLKQTLADMASVAKGIMDVSVVPGVAGVAGKAVGETGTTTLFGAVKQGAATGAKFGGAYGGLQGLIDNKDIQDTAHYLTNVLMGTGQGAVGGAVLGSGIAGVSHVVGKTIGTVYQYFKDKGASDQEAQAQTVGYFRDKLGRFATKVGETPAELKRRLDNIPVNDMYGEKMTLGEWNKKYGQSGAIDFGAKIGGKEGNQPSAVTTEPQKQPVASKPLPWETGKPIQPEIPLKEPLTPQDINTLKNAPVTTNKYGNNENLLKNLIPNYKPESTDIQNLLRERRGAFDFQKDLETRNSQPLMDYWNGQSKEARLTFMQRVQQGLPQPTPELQALADHYRGKFDVTYKMEQDIKPDIPYKSDYFTKAGIWANPQQANEFYSAYTKRTLAGVPQSFYHAPFPTILDGVKYGLELKRTNPEEIYLNNFVQVAKAKMASVFINEAEARGYDMKKVQDVVNKVMDPGFGHTGWYTTLRQVNGVLNTLDLSLSGFHVLGTAINASVSKTGMGLNQLLTGHPIKALGSFIRAPTASLEYVMRGNRIMSEANRGQITPDIRNIIEGGGRVKPQSIYRGSGLHNAIQSTINDINSGHLASGILKAPPRAVGAVLSEVSKPIMDWWVPRLKNGAAADLIENNMKNLPQGATDEMIRQIKASAIDSIDNRFGQLVQDNLFWNKSVKQLLQLGMRSPGWNIGTVRELGLGARDLFDIKRLFSGQGLSDRAAYTVSLPIVVGLLGAAYQYLHTGQGPQQLVDYFYPKTGAVDPNTGKEERVSFPTYAKDVVAFMHDPLQTIGNKVAPLVGDVLEQAKGTDYFGKPFVDTTASLPKQLQQRVVHEAVKHIPFSISSGIRRMNVNPETIAESLFGINKAPASIMGGYYDEKSTITKSLSPDQQKVFDYVTQPSSQGGPSASDRASVLMKNQWAIPYMQKLQITANPNNPIWSLPDNQLKLYLSYKATSDPQIRANIVLAMNKTGVNVFQLEQKYSDFINKNVQASKITKEQQQNSIGNKIFTALGGYTPPPLTPLEPFTQKEPTPKSQLPPDRQMIVTAYTAAPKGSEARRALLAQNPWLKDYWNQNTAYYKQNPITSQGPLADFLRGQGINPDTAQAGGSYKYPPKVPGSFLKKPKKLAQMKFLKVKPMKVKTLKLPSLKYKAPKALTFKKKPLKLKI